MLSFVLILSCVWDQQLYRPKRIDVCKLAVASIPDKYQTELDSRLAINLSKNIDEHLKWE